MVNSKNTDAESQNASRRVLIILLLLYVVNFSDRQLIAALSPIIKSDLSLSDTELGVLKGFAYILIYAFIGIPIAHLADKFSRTHIIFMSLAVWSSFTALCGLAQNITQLTLARVGFGIGAAGSSPASHSLIATHYPPTSRGLALSIYNLGIPLGHLVAFCFGGILAAAFGWRATLVTFGVLGLLLIFAKKLITEPQANTTEVKSGQQSTPSLYQSIHTLVSLPNFGILCFTAALASFSVSGLAAWVIDFFIRASEFKYSQVSVMTGLIYGIFGSIGMLTGGFLSDRSGGASHPHFLRLPGVCLLLGSPVLFFAIWASGDILPLLLMTITITLLYSFQGPMFAYAQTIAPPELRATGASLLIFVINIAGAGMGPLMVGIISDYFQNTQGESEALKIALSSLSISLALAGSGFLYISNRKKVNQAKK